MTIGLRSLDAENWERCVALTVRTDQDEFVVPNVYSIAQTRFEPTWQPLVIYDDERMVGFLMYDCADYEVVRLMIDQPYQGRGYGTAAMKLLIDHFEQEYAHPFTTTSYVPDNQVAEHLYASLGYRPTGEIKDGEIVVKLDLHR